MCITNDPKAARLVWKGQFQRGIEAEPGLLRCNSTRRPWIYVREFEHAIPVDFRWWTQRSTLKATVARMFPLPKFAAHILSNGWVADLIEGSAI
ncbi:MAG: hypothetical protein JOY54_06735 [Acidobacteriaceae bacterium]|nr:hypothetical protein [Acidobacteriaceae bacterium]